MITLSQLKGMVSVEGVSASLDNQIFDSLTANDSENALTACQSAARWAFAFMHKADMLNAHFNQDALEVITEAMTMMAIYELLRASEFYDEEYKEDAIALMNAGLGISGADENGNRTFIGAASAKDEQSRIKKPFYH